MATGAAETNNLNTLAALGQTCSRLAWWLLPLDGRILLLLLLLRRTIAGPRSRCGSAGKIGWIDWPPLERREVAVLRSGHENDGRLGMSACLGQRIPFRLLLSATRLLTLFLLLLLCLLCAGNMSRARSSSNYLVLSQTEDQHQSEHQEGPTPTDSTISALNLLPYRKAYYVIPAFALIDLACSVVFIAFAAHRHAHGLVPLLLWHALRPASVMLCGLSWRIREKGLVMLLISLVSLITVYGHNRRLSWP